MRIYYVNKNTLYDNPEVGVYQDLMFHGEALRHGAERPGASYNLLEDDLRLPLWLVKNVYDVSPIFCPGIDLIVSQEVREELERFEFIVFLEVKYEKLFDVPYSKGVDYYHLLEPDYPETLFDAYDHDASLADKIGRRFEMVVPRLSHVIGRYQDKVKISVRCPGCAVLKTEMSLSMLDEFPIVWESGFVMNDEAYSVIEGYIDRDYFDCYELEVGDEQDEDGHRICMVTAI